MKREYKNPEINFTSFEAKSNVMVATSDVSFDLTGLNESATKIANLKI